MVRGLVEAREGYKIIECFSGDTEVLTEVGWVQLKDFEDLSLKVAQYDIDTKTISFATPLRKTVQENRETLHYSDKNVDIWATPNHNILTTYGGKVTKSPFGSLSFNAGKRFIKAGMYENDFKVHEDLTRFLAMYVSDGTMYDEGYVKFGFSKERKITRCEDILNSLDIPYRKTFYFDKRRGKEVTSFRLGKEMSKFINLYCDKDKNLGWNSLFDLPSKVYLDESSYWDGHIRPNGLSVKFKTVSKQTADVMQAMGTLCNTRVSLRENRYNFNLTGGKSKIIYDLSYRLDCKSVSDVSSKFKGFNETKVQNVYCLTMPKGTLVTRLSNKVSIQGNCDYSQAELRVASWFSGDENMQEAYNSGSDLHQSTLKLIYGDNIIDPEVDHDGAKRQRTNAKISNFSLVYGAVPQSLVNYAKGWGIAIPLKEAEELHKAFFKAYPKLNDFYERCKSFTRQHGYIESPIGRKRWLPDIYSSDWKKKSSAERQCINTPVQGMASDICISALADITFDKTLDHSKFAVLGSVHDAILIECKEEYAEELGKKVVEIMSNPSVLKDAGIKMPVPLKADLVIDKKWGD